MLFDLPIVTEEALHDSKFTFHTYLNVKIEATSLYNLIIDAEEMGMITKKNKLLFGEEMEKEVRKMKYKFLILWECFEFDGFENYKAADLEKIEDWRKEIGF